MLTVFQKITNLLDKNSIIYSLFEHREVRTSEEAAKARGVDIKSGVKSMLIKSNNFFFLFVLPGDKKINWKSIKKILNSKSVNFASESEAESITQVKMGSVPPFGNLLNIPTYFDNSLKDKQKVNFNPGSTKYSISMNMNDLIKLTQPLFENFIN